MTQQRATRKYDDSVYGNSGYWYYHWPALHCVFRTDYREMKFNPDEETIELTLEEFIDLELRYDRNRRGPRPQVCTRDKYYYVNYQKEVFSQDEVVDPNSWGTVELIYPEYIELSIKYNQNPDETLL